ncbi:MAG: NAD(P)/FAD-dependent oxidoreductase [Armatimonas sp.]
MDEDVIVVGGSFAGLSAAMQLARARRRVLIVDGGQPRNRFAKASHGFFGLDGRPPLKMIETARKQVLAYPTVRFEKGEAIRATQEGQGFSITLSSGATIGAKRLILATGITDILPNVPGLKELWGVGVAHCPYCHGYEVAGRKLAVLMPKENPNIHQAILLRDWSDDITLLTNGAPAPIGADAEHLHQRGIRVDTQQIVRAIGRGKELEAIEFADGQRTPYDALFTATRWTLSSPLAEQLGCELDTSGAGPIVKTDPMKESTIPGVFVAGDAARLYSNATMASADGVMAGTVAHRSLILGV